MCDSFDMACHDASSALQLNIEVNSENLLPNSQRYNVGSLRLPADPSWPKIPQRRLADDLGEIIEPPCVVTLTGTPKKSRTTVRPSHSHQHAESTKAAFSRDQVPGSFHNVYQKVPTPNHPMKRRPGCADPRFKRVTTVKSQMTPSEPSDRDRDNLTEQSRSALIILNQTQCATENVKKIVPEKDTDTAKITQQEAETPGDIKEMDSVAVRTIRSHVETTRSNDNPKKDSDDIYISNESQEQKIFDEKKLSTGESYDTSLKNFLEHAEDEKSTYSESGQKAEKINKSKEENSLHNVTIPPNSHISVKHESACLQYCQGNAGQFFLVVENKAQAPSLSAIQIDPSPVSPCQCNTQCYNVQVPVLSYQNLPLQISTQTPTKIEIPSQLSLSPLLTIPSSPFLKNSANIPPDVANGHFSATSQEPDVTRLKERQHSVPVHTIGQVGDTVSSASAPKKSAASPQNAEKTWPEGFRAGRRYFENNEKNKNPIGSEAEAEERRKTLGTPPIKLERKYDENCQLNDVRIDDGRVEQSFDKSVLSDTTDSELYGVKTTETKTNRIHRDANETSGSGTDCDDCFQKRSINDNNDRGQTKTKRRKLQIYCSTATSKDVVCSKNTEAHCPRTRASSIDDRESSKPRANGKRFSGSQRKMKSEQNLVRSLSFGEKGYKNISDPHITDRETYGERDALAYRSSYGSARRKRENRFTEEEIVDEMCEASCNRQNTDLTTEIDSDAQNFADLCDTDRTDLSNIEQSKNIGDAPEPDKPTVLPVKTQQLLNKSYMEYYDKLRSSSIEKDGSAQQRYMCQMAMGAPQVKKRRANLHGEIPKINEQKKSSTGFLTLEKLSALSNIINRNLNPAEKNFNDTSQTRQLYVNENMRSSSDPTAGTQSAILKGVIAGDSADVCDSSVPSTMLIDIVKRKREKPVERRLLKLKTIAFFGFMMYAMLVLLPMMYSYFLYDAYDDYEDLSYIELMLEYVVSSFREAFGGLFDTINDLLFRPVIHD